jgi:hypothetical protein
MQAAARVEPDVSSIQESGSLTADTISPESEYEECCQSPATCTI